MIDKKYPLEKIHDIRKLRVEAARSFLLKKKRDVAIAEQQLSVKQEELVKHDVRFRQVMDEEYKRIADNEITYKRWNDFRDIEEWERFERSRIMSDMDCAKEALERAKVKEQKAMEEYRKREMNVIKLDAHRDIWKQEKYKAEKRAENNGGDT